MDILIKNMDKPKSCDDCRFTEQGQGYLTCAITGDYAIDSTYKSCPLVALPPHGRLKDYDKIKEALTKNFDVHADSLVYYILSLIEETDTIVEAST